MSPLVPIITRYMLKAFWPCRQWEWPIALGWVNWHFGLGYLATAMDTPNTQNILGVAVVRPVRCPCDGAIAYRHDPDGACLFIDCFVASCPEAYPLLSNLFKERFGPRKMVAYSNQCHFMVRGRNRDTRLIIKDYETFLRNVKRGGIKSRETKDNGTATTTTSSA